jgi:hypothetical protein
MLQSVRRVSLLRDGSIVSSAWEKSYSVRDSGIEESSSPTPTPLISVDVLVEERRSAAVADCSSRSSSISVKDDEGFESEEAQADENKVKGNDVTLEASTASGKVLAKQIRGALVQQEQN